MSQRIPAGYRCDFSSCKSLLSLCCGLILGLCSMLCVASHVSATKDYPIDLWEGTDATGAGPTDTGQMAVGQLMPHPDEGQRELKLQDNEQFLKVRSNAKLPMSCLASIQPLLQSPASSPKLTRCITRACLCRAMNSNHIQPNINKFCKSRLLLGGIHLMALPQAV